MRLSSVLGLTEPPADPLFMLFFVPSSLVVQNAFDFGSWLGMCTFTKQWLTRTIVLDPVVTIRHLHSDLLKSFSLFIYIIYWSPLPLTSRSPLLPTLKWWQKSRIFLKRMDYPALFSQFINRILRCSFCFRTRNRFYIPSSRWDCLGGFFGSRCRTVSDSIKQMGRVLVYHTHPRPACKTNFGDLIRCFQCIWEQPREFVQSSTGW